MPSIISIGDEQYSLVEVSNKKWPKNESAPEKDEYELHILKYDAN
jgi:hypothetical protein